MIEITRDIVLLLKKVLYGLKVAPRCLYDIDVCMF